jgi:hypothetical protein
MRHLFLCSCLLLSLGGELLAAPAPKGNNSQQATDQSKPPVDQSKQAADHSKAATNVAQADRGEQVFNTNCVRCHTPPGGMPQRVTGTVVMHMRVRARLSREEEQALLRFLAP